MVNHSDKEADVLHSWKEISQHLNVEARTCQRWEKQYGLPVHRFTDSPRSRVFAYKNELDDWMERKGPKGLDIERTSRSGNKKFLKVSFVIPFIVILILLVFFIWKKFRPIQPVGFEIKTSNLIVLNEKGKELWKYDTRIENLDKSIYIDRFQYKKLVQGIQTFPIIMIKDINNDHFNEVLLSIYTLDGMNSSDLLFFNHLGKKLWTFESGRELKFGDRIYSSDYRIGGLEVIDINNDGTNEILLFSEQQSDFPTQFCVLNVEGEIQGEYWHSGRISDVEFIDINNDGIDEIVLGAMNNEYKKGSVIVFDSGNIKGGSPQMVREFRCDDIKPGSEKYYILLPTTDVVKLNFPMGNCSAVRERKNGRIEAIVRHTMLYYEFDKKFNLLDLRSSHAFEMMHKEAVREGKIDSVIDDAYFQKLKEGILYWNGKEWTTTPSMSNPW
jgi:hypothetical protein